MLHDGRVLVQERFAIGAVGDDGVGLGGEFDVGRKATTTGAHDASLTNLVNETHRLGRGSYGSAAGDFQTKLR